MMARVAQLMFIVFLTLMPSGCRKSAGSPTAALVAIDYRTWNGPAIEIMITQKTGFSVTLNSAGPNKYTGTRQAPGETKPIPVTVTVEAERIVIESSAPDGTTARDVIDADGKLHSDLR